MSTVLAKFRLTSVEDTKYAAVEGSVNLALMAVQGEPFGPSTPSGYLNMTIQNPAAAKLFKDAYETYLAAARAWHASEAPLSASADARGEYPRQPEFYLTFKLDDGTGSD